MVDYNDENDNYSDDVFSGIWVDDNEYDNDSDDVLSDITSAWVDDNDDMIMNIIMIGMMFYLISPLTGLPRGCRVEDCRGSVGWH